MGELAHPLRIAVIGAGAIGSVVAEQLAAHRLAGCSLAGVARRGRRPTVADLLPDCDLVVEAAGHEAVTDHADQVLAAGIDLVLCSVGALARPDLSHLVAAIATPTTATPTTGNPAVRGRLLPVSGAVGGFDLLAALRLAGPVDSVTLTTTKQPSALGVDVGDRGVVFMGSAREAALTYPATANVAASVALATVGLDRAMVRVVADPTATGSTHELTVRAALGDYRFRFENRTAPGAPRTSAVVPWSVLALLAAEASRRRLPPQRTS